VWKKTKQWTASIVYVICTAIFALLWLFPSAPVAFASVFFLGLCYSFAISYVFTYCPLVVPDDRKSAAIGFISSLGNVFMFITAYFITGLRALSGSPLYIAILPYVAVCGAIITAVNIVLVRLLDGQKKNTATVQ
jgi:hypothetical protein